MNSITLWTEQLKENLRITSDEDGLLIDMTGSDNAILNPVVGSLCGKIEYREATNE